MSITITIVLLNYVTGLINTIIEEDTKKIVSELLGNIEIVISESEEYKNWASLGF